MDSLNASTSLTIAQLQDQIASLTQQLESAQITAAQVPQLETQIAQLT